MAVSRKMVQVKKSTKMNKAYYYWSSTSIYQEDQDVIVLLKNLVCEPLVTPTGKWLMALTEERWYYELPDGKGDLVTRMARYAIITGDPDVIKACIKLLNERKRWPDAFNGEHDAKNWFDYKWSHLLFKLKINPLKKYRSQRSVTRDPYIMLTCAIYLHQYEMIRDLKIPWWLQRFDLWHWKKYLETSDMKHKDKYELLLKMGIDISAAFKFPGYVKSLNAWMAYIARSKEIKDYLLPYIPHWNLLNRMLCGDVIYQDDLDRYISSKGWLWDRTILPDMVYELGDCEPVYLDRDILYAVYENKTI